MNDIFKTNEQLAPQPHLLAVYKNSHPLLTPSRGDRQHDCNQRGSIPPRSHLRPLPAPARDQKREGGSRAQIPQNGFTTNPPELQHRLILHNNHSLRRPPHQPHQNHHQKPLQGNIGQPAVGHNSLLPENKKTTQWQVLLLILQHSPAAHLSKKHQRQDRRPVGQQIPTQNGRLHRCLREDGQLIRLV